MDFFEAQARAKKRTSRLVALFGLAVLGTIFAGYLVALLVVLQTEERRSGHPVYVEQEHPGRPSHRYWRPDVFTPIALGTIIVVGLGSVYKWWQFRHGGATIAESLGGRQVDPQTTDLAERRLLNIVEEMAIASGVPVPAVYLLNDEPSINAFAAGLTTSDAVVAVTRGTLEKLTRDELQGVVGHEFSHILNGDMRLNVRISAILFGILLIGLIGRTILHNVSRSRLRGAGKSPAPIVGLVGFGLALLIIGYIGYFFGRLIQAAVSRQREFLADASAVQFTRNPAGLGGALKKIGGYALGSLIITSKGTDLGHFFFGQAFRSGFTGVWSTHPPLTERIRAIDPQFDGKMFEPPEVVDIARESFASAGFGGGARYTADETARRIHAAQADVPPLPPVIRVPFRAA
ncbi:MAG: M48 family metalloprotease, partial [Verrucomicrobia bacterium]|nr:M48 family metalloprotease [Verrucomicrobiota bacterium]